MGIPKFDNTSIPYLKDFAGDSSNRLGKIFLASALLETNKIKEAIKVLKEINPNENGVYLKQYKSWYLGLAYLNDQKIEQATDLFKSLNYSGGVYENESKEILILINKLQ